MSHAYLAYPVAAILALAASLPIVATSMFLDSGSAPSASAARQGASVVVSTSGGGARPPLVAPPPIDRGAPSTDERWWRSQAGRTLTTTSIMTAPSSAPGVPDSPARTAPPEPISPPAPVSQIARIVDVEVRLTERVPAQIRRWEPLILKAARNHDVDPALIAAVMMTESSGNATAVSPMGAVGLMQVLDGPADPEANVDVGVRMLSSHLRRFGSIDLALAAYNAGIGNVLTHGGVPPFQETRDHITRTLASYSAWRAY